MTRVRWMVVLAVVSLVVIAAFVGTEPDPARDLTLKADLPRAVTAHSAQQLEARKALLALSPAVHDYGTSSDRCFMLSNSSSALVFRVNGYNASLPFYWLQVRRGTNWEGIATGISFPPADEFTLNPYGSWRFAAVVPTGEVYRIGVRCDLTKQPSRLLMTIRSLLKVPQPAPAEPRMFWCYSPPISPGE